MVIPTEDDWAGYYRGKPLPPTPEYQTPEGCVRVSSKAFHAVIGPLSGLEGTIVSKWDNVFGYRTDFHQDRRLVGVSIGGTHLCPRLRFLAQRWYDANRAVIEAADQQTHHA